jgi:hypothetical protein
MAEKNISKSGSRNASKSFVYAVRKRNTRKAISLLFSLNLSDERSFFFLLSAKMLATYEFDDSL